MEIRQYRVGFICVYNSYRSQIAEALGRIAYIRYFWKLFSRNRNKNKNQTRRSTPY